MQQQQQGAVTHAKGSARIGALALAHVLLLTYFAGIAHETPVRWHTSYYLLTLLASHTKLQCVGARPTTYFAGIAHETPGDAPARGAPLHELGREERRHLQRLQHPRQHLQRALLSDH